MKKLILLGSAILVLAAGCAKTANVSVTSSSGNTASTNNKQTVATVPTSSTTTQNLPVVAPPKMQSATITPTPQAPTGTWYGFTQWGFKIQIPKGFEVDPLSEVQYATTPEEDSYVLNVRTPSEYADYIKNGDEFRPSLTIEVASNPTKLSVLDWAQSHESDAFSGVTNITIAGKPGITYVDSNYGLTVYIFSASTTSQNGKVANITARSDISQQQLTNIIQSITFQ